jgi:hypothetical protein
MVSGQLAPTRGNASAEPIAADPAIAGAREAAAVFAKSLPDYIVKRTTTRYQGFRPLLRPTWDAGNWVPPADAAGMWRTIDTVTGDVATKNGAEVYTNITVNGRPAKNLPDGGSWSTGEFSTVLLGVLAAESATRFTNQRQVSIANRPSYRYNYAVDQPHSAWTLAVGKGDAAHYSPAYGGAIWIDKQTGQVLRIEMSARGLSLSYPMDAIELATDYDFVKIGETEYCLPVHSEAFSCWRNGNLCLRNETIFRDYGKFGAKTSVTFDSNSN